MPEGREQMIFRVLGSVAAVGRDGAELPLRAAKVRTLLGVLLAHADARVPADVLRAALWPDRPPRSATANLQTYVSELRRVLPPVARRPRLVLDRSGYRLAVRPGELDHHSFEALAGEGRRELAAGRPARAVEALRRACGLWRGEPFEDVPHVADEALAHRLREQHWVVRESLVETRLALGDRAGLVAELDAMIAAAPLREGLWLLQMRVLSDGGRRAEALARYRRLHRLLDTELGIGPGVELRRLHQRILTGQTW
ncbi:AfsR/SARP family transcriptional regulator [Saccharothrix xinjiangensis]|uniref:AfsR/SARP family transcriptional regulator n=1 Tax=Saccharothrix xinjiangensis TaxID=204798 RepID=A0ABV9Y774_9PSEU